MAPNPLRGALAFLLCAVLALPARSVDIAVPGESGNVNGNSGQAGTVGGLTPGTNGGVSVVPSLGLGLSPTLGVNAAPTPLAQPVPASFVAPLSSDFNPPPGYIGHDPAKPVSADHPSHGPAPDAPRVDTRHALDAFLANPPAPPAIDRPKANAPTAGEIDAKLAGLEFKADDPSSAAKLKALYDGGAIKSAAAADPVLFPVLSPEHGSGLVPAAKSFGKKGVAPVPPAPKGVLGKGWLKGAVTGMWSAVKGAFAKSDAAGMAEPITVLPPVAIVKPAAAPAASDAPAAPAAAKEADGRILVRASRGVRYDALGYRVLFTKPEARGLTVAQAPDESVSVRLERGQDAEETAELRARFASFNALIETNFAALELIAQSSSKMTVKTARLVATKTEEMARLYGEMVGPENAVNETASIAALGIALDAAVRGLSDGDPLPAKAVELVMPIEKESYHHYINKLHQQSLEAVGRSNTASPANLTVRMGEGDAEKAVSLVDLSENPLVKGSRVVSPGFKALLAAMSRSKDTPKGSLIMQDHQFWGHFKLGAHSAEIYASFLQPDEGGMIRVRYQEWGTGYDNQTRLYYVGRLLHKAGFHVDQKNGFLTAVIDKDHAAQTVDEMTDTFALVVQALHATVGVDFALPLLVKGAKTSEEVGRRIDDWVDTVMGEGTLPFYVHDDQSAMVEGSKKYAAEKTPRALLRAALNRNLEDLGLPHIPAEERIGQRTIDRFVNEPIEKAIARGQLRLAPDGKLLRDGSYDALASLAASFRGESVAGAKMAEVVSSLDPALFKYETIGALGGLTVERAQRRLDPGAWITVYVLRDPKGGQIGLARAEVSALRPGEKRRLLTPASLFSALRAQGLPVAEFAPSETPPGTAHFRKLLRELKEPRASSGQRFQGMAASPGHGRTLLARVTYDKALAAKGGYIFIAPYTTPDDLDAIKGSKAVLTTSGGLLSHAAITTREMGIPAAILPGVEWKDGVASLNTFGLGKARMIGDLVGRAARPEPPFVLHEGEVVRLDPATGVVETFRPGQSAALLDAAGELERFDAGGTPERLVAWFKSRLAAQALQHEQKAVLAREAVSGLFARSLSDPRGLDALSRVLAVVPADIVGSGIRSTLDALLAAEIEDAVASMKSLHELVEESLSTESLERLVRGADARLRGLSALTERLGRPKSELSTVVFLHNSLREEAVARHGKLLSEEMADLQRHARLFPAATVEALPRMKAAIAKARRRGMNPEMIRAWEEQAKRLEDSRRAAMQQNAPAVLPFSAILDVDVPWVGGKAAKLGEISAVVRAAGGEVPPGIALTVHAYRRFLKESGIAEKLEAVAADTRLTPDQRSERARKLILGAKLDAGSGVGKEILAGLAAQGLDQQSLAVRSSAVDEDGAEAAFAGAGDTHLYVNPGELLEHVKDVWASLWNPRALLYRETRGLSTTNLAQAVVVQAMVDSQISGVAFTQDPVSGSSGRVIVNGAFGLGEGIVSGRVAPDQYVLSKTDGREILPPMISDKKLAIIRGKDGRGTIEQKMPPEWRRRRSMSPAQLQLLADVSVALERHFGYALDIEFGFVENKLYILQSRAVTSNAVEKPAPVPPVPAGSLVKPTAPKPKRLMFVCTGNTCRSPMAAHLAREKLERRGRGDIEVVSRGLSVATEGESMNPLAKAQLQNWGVDAEGHQAKALTSADVAGATLILTMTEVQAEAARARFPEAKARIFSLAQYTKAVDDIADPYGGDAAAYRAAALEIGDALEVLVNKIPPGTKKGVQ